MRQVAKLHWVWYILSNTWQTKKNWHGCLLKFRKLIKYITKYKYFGHENRKLLNCKLCAVCLDTCLLFQILMLPTLRPGWRQVVYSYTLQLCTQKFNTYSTNKQTEYHHKLPIGWCWAWQSVKKPHQTMPSVQSRKQYRSPFSLPMHSGQSS